MKPILFTKDAKVEQLLKDFGVEWVYEPELPMKSIDKRASRNNQVRFEGPIDETQVNTIARSLDAGQGDLIPALIGNLTSAPGAKIIVITLADGNNRHEGVLRASYNYPTVGLYTIRVNDPEKVRRIGVAMNIRNGRGNTAKSQAHHIIRDHLDLDISIKDSADVYWMDYGVAKAVIAEEQGVRKGLEHGFHNARRNSRLFMRPFSIKNDEVYDEAVRFLLTAKMSEKPMSQFVTEVNKASRSVKAGLAVIEKWRSERPWEEEQRASTKSWDGGASAALSRVANLTKPSRTGYSDSQISQLKDLGEACVAAAYYFKTL